MERHDFERGSAARRDFSLLAKIMPVTVPVAPAHIESVHSAEDRKAQVAAWAREAIMQLRLEVYDYGAEPWQGSTYAEVSGFIERFFGFLAKDGELERFVAEHG